MKIERLEKGDVLLGSFYGKVVESTACINNEYGDCDRVEVYTQEGEILTFVKGSDISVLRRDRA